MIATLLVSALCAPPAPALPPQDPAAGARRFGGQGSALGALFAPAADRNGDGAVSAAEWKELVDSMGPEVDGHLERANVKAVLLMPAIDRDGDRRISRAELDAALSSGDTETGRRGRGIQGFTVGMVVQIADADGDGTVDADERAALFGGADAATAETFAEWIVTTEADVPEDRSAFTPSVFLLTMDSWLDVDTDGRITRADLDTIRANLDANGDGDLSAEELAPRRQARAGAGAGGRRNGGWGEPITDADRAAPPLVPWQRDLADALAIQARTGKPLLIAVNADGEPASESLAWKRYRDPEFAALAEGFVCLVTSPDRRTPRDYDDRGRRLVDERFGRIVNGEALSIEPVLYERWFDGRRVAPRHIGVAPDGTVLFDLAMVNDLTLIDRALEEHGRPGPATPDPATLSDAQLLDSPDAGHRAELERRFVNGDRSARIRLAHAALDPSRDTQQPQLVRLALRDDDPAVRAAGVDVLAAHETPSTLELFRRAFRVAVADPGATAQLIDALDRIALGEGPGALLAEAATRRDLQVGLSLRSGLVDVGQWQAALAFAPEPAPAPTAAERDALDQALTAAERARRERPGPDVDVEFARLTLRYALATLDAGDDPTFLLEDALRYAEHAIASAREDGRAHAYAARCAHLLDDADAAVHHAMHALTRLTRHAGTRIAADTLALFAQRRVQAIYAAMADNAEVPATWIADANAAYAVLLDHPAATESALRAYLDWLNQIGGWGIEADAAPRAVAKFPESAALHERWRSQLLRDDGARALEAAYDAGAPDGADAATWEWFRGLAKLVAAERHVEDRRPGDALAAYARSVETFDASIALNADFRDSASHYQALSLAAMARLFADRGDLDAAAKLARAALDKRPASADSPDGLGETPRATAAAIATTLETAGRAVEASALRGDRN